MPPILTMCRLGASPWRRHYWRRELGGEPQSKGSESPILAVSQVFFHSTFEAAAAHRTLRSPSLRHGRGLEAGTPEILRIDLADILAEAVAAGGGEAGVDGRHKGGHKAETTAATASPSAISASSTIDSNGSNDDASDNETSSLNEHSMQWIRRNGKDLKHATASWWYDEGFWVDDANTVDWVKCGNYFGSNTVLKEMTIKGFGRGIGEDPESFSRSSNFVHFCHALSCNRSLEGLSILACTFDTELTELAFWHLGSRHFS